MEKLDPVYCPKCKLGFSPQTRVCPSCSLELVEYDEIDNIAEVNESTADLSGFNLLRMCDAGWGRSLLEKLTENEISFRALPQYGHGMMSIYVPDEFLESAKRIDHEVFQSQVPGTESVRNANDLPFGDCPGCGAPLGAKDNECRSCGLIMSGKGWVCTNCMGELDGEEKVCPHCGEKIDRERI